MQVVLIVHVIVLLGILAYCTAAECKVSFLLWLGLLKVTGNAP